MHALLGFSIAAQRLPVKAKGFRFMGSGVDRNPLTCEDVLKEAGCQWMVNKPPTHLPKIFQNDLIFSYCKFCIYIHRVIQNLQHDTTLILFSYSLKMTNTIQTSLILNYVR